MERSLRGFILYFQLRTLCVVAAYSISRIQFLAAQVIGFLRPVQPCHQDTNWLNH